MGCGSSTGTTAKVEMLRIQLPDLDRGFKQIQDLIDDIYEARDSIQESFDYLLRITDFDETVGATAHQAAVGIVFAIVAHNRGFDTDRLFESMDDAPYIEISRRNASGKEDMISALSDYIKVTVHEQGRIQKMSEEIQDTLNRVPDMWSEFKDNILSEEGLGHYAKLRLISNSNSNFKNLAKLSIALEEINNEIADEIYSFKAARRELNSHIGDYPSIGRGCAAKGLVSPKECYLEYGDKIYIDRKIKKRYKALYRRRKALETSH